MSRTYKPKRRDMLPLWTDAYLADTSILSTQQHGAYLLLLMKCWRTKDCRLPNDDVKLARCAGLTKASWKRIKDDVLDLWDISNCGKWVSQKRLMKEHSGDVEYRRQQSQSAKGESKNDSLGSRKVTPTEAQAIDITQSRGNPADADAEVSLNGDIKDTAKAVCKKPPKKPPKRRTGLQDGWLPNPISEDLSTKLNLTEEEYKHEFSKFKDGAKANNRTYVDWNAAWRTWLQSDWGTWGRRKCERGNIPAIGKQSSAASLAQAFDDVDAGIF